MSQFYDLASLVVIPSGYKASTIYAQKPLTTDGQLSFSRASTATRVNASGLIEAVASNVPRLDYLGSTCPRLLLEPQRTNVVTYSESFDNAAWIKTNAGTGLDPVVTANNAISPDGTQNADTVVFNSGAGTTAGDYSFLYQPVITGAGSHTASFYAKTASGTAQILVRLDSGQYQKITITNQWQRFTLTQTLLAGTNFLDFILRRGIDEPLNASATIQLWGAQVEAGAYATSYIPTLGASVTRVADAASKTGISSLIGQTEGVLFVDVVINGQQNASCNILNSEKSVVDSFYIQRTSSGTINAGIFANSVLYNVNAGSVAIGQRTKIALAYKSGSMALYINGVLIGTRTESWTFSSSLDDIFLNDVTTYFAYQENVSFNQALLFKTRLTNAQLAELTTL
jgi:hypothetical protein